MKIAKINLTYFSVEPKTRVLTKIETKHLSNVRHILPRGEHKENTFVDFSSLSVSKPVSTKLDTRRDYLRINRKIMFI